MGFKIYLPVLLLMFFSYQSFAQRYPKDTYNSLGIQAGMNYGGLTSDNFNFTKKSGFSAGLATRANIYNKFIFLYGLNYFQYNSGIEVMEEGSSRLTEIDFATDGVQINFFVGHKILGDYLSIQAGPVLQINSKFSPEEGMENSRIPGYNLVAEDLEDISKLNFAVAGEVSAGIRRLKIFAQYQYGLSNMFRNFEPEDVLTTENEPVDLNAKLMLATLGIVFYL